MIGGETYQVLAAVLDHLDKTHFIDNLEKECPYIVEMIVDNYEIFSDVDSIGETTSDQLLRIYQQTRNQYILDLLLEKSDKSKKLYQTITSYKFWQSPPESSDQFLNELSAALDLVETEKADFCLR